MESRSEKILDFFKGKALKMYENKSGLIQLIPIVVVLSLIAIVCPLFSGFTEFTEMYHQFSAKDSAGGLFWAVCLMGAIEGVKLVAGSVFFVKIWSGAWDYILIFLVLFVAAQVFSVLFSIEGSKRVPETLGTPPAKIAARLIDVDSINSVHDTLISHAELKENLFFKKNSKFDSKIGGWRIKSTFAGEHKKDRQDTRTAYQEKKMTLKDVATKQIILNEKATAEHLESVAKYEASNRSKGATFWYLSVFIELIYFLSQAFLTWFYYQLFSENGTDKDKRPKVVKQKVTTNGGTVSGTTSPRPAIAHLGNGTTKNGTDSGTVRACLVCGTDITNKRKDAKFCSSQCRKGNHVNNKQP